MDMQYRVSSHNWRHIVLTQMVLTIHILRFKSIFFIVISDEQAAEIITGLATVNDIPYPPVQWENILIPLLHQSTHAPLL